MKPRNTVVSVGRELAEIKIYTLRSRGGYRSFQCCWYELGKRQAKTFGHLRAAKLFAQQKTVALANGLTEINESTLRDVEVFKDCENRIAKFGLSIPSVIQEWIALKESLPNVPLSEAVQYYRRHHGAIKRMTVAEAIALFLESKKGAGLSDVYLSGCKVQFEKVTKGLGSYQLGEVAQSQIDQFLRGLPGGPVYKNNFRRVLVTLFNWARKQGYLEADRKTAADRAMNFSLPDTAPAIWTCEEMRKILSAAPARLIPLLAIGAFSGIRSAEIARLEWQDVLWDRGYIEVKARKAKTKSRRLVPLKDNLKRWLEPFRKESGQISEVECSSAGLNSLGDAVGFKWRQNALRHSYASYRLAEIQSAAQVALELGNSPEKLFAHYRELVTPEAASEWFQIFPPEGWEPKKEVPRRRRLRPL